MDNYQQRYLIKPLSPETWSDFEQLFGTNGACAGCWCTWWRISSTDFRKFSKETKKNVMRTIVQGGKIPGLIVYVDGIPAGWVSVAPREEFLRMERSKILARVDEQPVWSINCFFINRHYRKKGLMSTLLTAALEFARSNGAKIVEAYPIDTQEKVSSSRLYYGVAETFRRFGFTEAARRSPDQPIMRLSL